MKKLYQVYTLLILFSLTSIETSTTAPKYAKDGCKPKCGNVKIPYPFGIGVNCSINKWYNVDCNSSTPYLSELNHLEVLGVDLENQTVTINTPIISGCNQTNSVDLGSSPFMFSKSQNIFVFEGCGNAAMMEHGSLLTGCSSTCRNDSTVSDKNNCLGISCCQTTIPHHVTSYSMNLTGAERVGGDRTCRSALFIDKDSYLKRRKSRQSVAEGDSYLPISLLWTLSDGDQASCCYYRRFKVQVDMNNGTSMDSWKCPYSTDFWKLEGNTYLRDGCHGK
ncbi:putative wall-associated receptor kinase, galacturonan-binding domain-containing protein [Helianthus debilis subsp. tardiflorus]